MGYFATKSLIQSFQSVFYNLLKKGQLSWNNGFWKGYFVQHHTQNHIKPTPPPPFVSRTSEFFWQYFKSNTNILIPFNLHLCTQIFLLSIHKWFDLDIKQELAEKNEHSVNSFHSCNWNLEILIKVVKLVWEC